MVFKLRKSIRQNKHAFEGIMEDLAPLPPQPMPVTASITEDAYAWWLESELHIRDSHRDGMSRLEASSGKIKKDITRFLSELAERLAEQQPEAFQTLTDRLSTHLDGSAPLPSLQQRAAAQTTEIPPVGTEPGPDSPEKAGESPTATIPAADADTTTTLDRITDILETSPFFPDNVKPEIDAEIVETQEIDKMPKDVMTEENK